MTKKGYKIKFFKSLCFFTVLMYIGYLYTSSNYSIDAIFGQFIFAGLYSLIPAVVNAFIREFFED